MLQFILFFVILTLGVDHNNFRTCEQTAFCRRSKTPSPHLEISKIKETTQTSITFYVKNEIEKATFELRINGIKNGIFRMKMIHIDGGVKFDRYEPEIGLSLVEEGIQEVPITIEQQSNEVTLKNEQSSLRIEFKTMKMTMKVNDKTVLIVNEKQNIKFEIGNKEINGKEVEGNSKESFKNFEDSKPHGPSSVLIEYTFPEAKKFFGIPEHATDVILKSTDSKGYKEPYRLYNTDVFEFELDSPMTLYGSVPVIYSLAKEASGVLHHNPSETFVFVEHQNVRFVSETGILDEFLLPGPKPIDLIKEYTQLSGKSPMVPKYSMAYHQCRWNYMSQDEANEVIEKMDEAKIPFDVLWLDIEHTDDKKYFTWKKSKFPDPPALIDNLKKAERRLVTIVDPHIKKTSSYYVYKEAEKDGYLVRKPNGKDNYEGWCWSGQSVYIDFINPKAREWWGTLYNFDKYQYSSPYQMIWIDMNEPSVFNGPETTMQKDNIHKIGDKQYEHRDVHNIYGLTYHKTTYDGLLKRTDGVDRPFILSRSFFVGSQKFGAIWTGDTDSTWEHLKASVAMTLNLNLVGIIQSGGDVGGFFRNPEEELLIRWYQVGTFYPFFRAHAHLDSKRREPYLYEGETRRRLKDAIEMKYLLLEYWYREYYNAVTTGEPLLRPLFIQYPEDTKTYDIDTQFMAGKDILVTGVFEKGKKSVHMYVPEGTWYDYYTNDKVKNGNIKVSVTMDSIPVLMRGGSVIPIKERKRRSSELMKFDPTTLLVYVDENGNAEGMIYSDDGLTTKKDHILSKITVNKNGINCKVIENINGNDLLPSKEIIKIIVVGMKRPISISNGDNKIYFDEYRTKEMNGKGFVIRKPNVNFDEDWSISFNEN